MNPGAEYVACLKVIGLLTLEAAFIVGLATAGARWLRSAQWQRALWQAAVLALGLLLGLEWSGVARDLGAFAWNGLVRTRMEAWNSSSVPKESEPRIRAEFRDRVQARLVQNGEGKRSSEMNLPEVARSRPVAVRHVERTEEEPFLSGHSWPWLELTWVVGFVAALTPGVLARLFFFLFHQRRRTCFDGALLQRVLGLARQMRIRHRVRVFESVRLVSPVAFGILRPSIGLPHGFSERFSVAQQDVMIAHELAHIRGHDLAWQALADLVAAMLWWQPLAWYVRHQLRLAAEGAADEASALVQDGPGLLAECLLQLASGTVMPPPSAWLSATGPGFRSGLGRRIERLLRPDELSWSPPRDWQSGAVKVVIVLGVVTAGILGTAWANPYNKEGTPMKTLKQTWKRSAATLTILAAFTAETKTGQTHLLAETARNLAPPASPHNAAAPGPVTVSDKTLVEDARLLVELGKLDEAEAKLSRADRYFPAERTDVRVALAGRIQELRFAQQQNSATTKAAPASVPTVAPVTPPEQAAPEDQPEPNNVYRMDPRLLERYGLMPRGRATATATNNVARSGRGKQQIENKLNMIVFNEVLYDGLPLSEVIRDVQEQTRRHDPAKQGINFIITSVPETPVVNGIDPTTGLPMAPVATDLNSAIVRLHLRDVRLKDVLDAVTRVADQPIKYTVEDYGIVLSPGPGQGLQPAIQSRVVEAPRLLVRTFRVDTNNFVAGLENAFGIAAVRDGEHKDPHAVQQALRQLLQQLGINTEVPGKAVFYNELTGILMVRGTAEDLELVQAAIETLGGRVLRTQNARNENGVGGDRMSATVLGKVARPGGIEWLADQRIDLVEAIARAGGFGDTANKNKIELSRNGQKSVYKFDSLRNGTDPDEKVWLEPGDLIFIHETFF